MKKDKKTEKPEVEVSLDNRGIPVWKDGDEVLVGLTKAHFTDKATEKKVGAQEFFLYKAAIAQSKADSFSRLAAEYEQKAEDAVREPSDKEKSERAIARLEKRLAAEKAKLAELG